jgi:predicted cupin superfamily sugar epimerase
MGDTVELICLNPDGSSELIKLGTNLLAGEVVQYVVKAGVMFGSRVKAGGEYALLGTTVAPGFDFADFEQGRREELVVTYPEREDLIRALTREGTES